MQSIQNYFRVVFSLAAILFTVQLSAQTLDSAKVLYNEGVAAIQEGNDELGIQKLEASLNISTSIFKSDEDPEAEALMTAIREKIPGLYYQQSIKKLKEKDMNAGYNYAVKAEQKAKEYGDNGTLEKTNNLLGNIYYSNALARYKETKLDEALAEVGKSIQESNNLKAHNLRLVILKDQSKDVELVEAAKAAIAAAEAQNDQDSKQKFSQLAGTYFYNAGVMAKQSGDNAKAIEKVTTSIEFNDQNADSYYLLTTLYNSQSNWDKAIAVANDGLKYETAGNQAKFYYELGTAYYGKGDSPSACQAFTKAAVGDYAENANYQKEHVVKCQ